MVNFKYADIFDKRRGQKRGAEGEGKDESYASPSQLLTELSYVEYREINQRGSSIYIFLSETKRNALGG